MNTLSEKLTTQFYQWERIGRGWYVFDTPVELEPTFVPFFGHSVSSPEVIDDGKRPSILSSISNRIRNAFASKEKVLALPEEDIYEPSAYRFVSEEPLNAFSISMPEGVKLKSEELIQFLVMLSNARSHISFEIIATASAIRLQFVCRESDSLLVQSQLKAYFPNCIITNHAFM